MPPKKLHPEFTRVPALKPKFEKVAIDVSKGLTRIFGQCIDVILLISRILVIF